MTKGFFRREQTSTMFITLDTQKCEACWKCLKACTHNVIGRINLPWHKHIRFINGGECTGCAKCVKVCKAGAISKFINE